MILVTGSTGHLGNVLVRLLVKRGYSVRAMVAPFEDTRPLDDLPVEIVKGDIRDLDSVMKASKKVDGVFHLAAVISILGRAKTVYEVNVKGTENVITACMKNGVGKLIYVSSIHAFADRKHGSLIDESVPIDPKMVKGAYAKSKAMATLKVLNAAKEGLHAVVVCPTGIVGPYDWRISEMGRLILTYFTGKMKLGVEGSFDFVDVRDVAELLANAYERAESGEVFIASGYHITIRALIQTLEEIGGKRSTTLFLPKHIAYPIAAAMALYYQLSKKKALLTPYSIYTVNRGYVYSHRKATKLLGYNPRDLRESLEDAIAWFTANGYLSVSVDPMGNVPRAWNSTT